MEGKSLSPVDDPTKACHPWVRVTDFNNYEGKPVSFVGKVKSVDSQTMVLTDHAGKFH